MNIQVSILDGGQGGKEWRTNGSGRQAKILGTSPANLGSNSGSTTYQFFVFEPEVTSLIFSFLSLRISGELNINSGMSVYVT